MNTITSALASLWAACWSEWAAMGEAGQAMALGVFGLTTFMACAVALAIAIRRAEVDPDWATDADHVPQGENWQKIVEAHLRAEKEQAG